jgi:CubicO group peptidase (beta-lactamase class C family)
MSDVSTFRLYLLRTQYEIGSLTKTFTASLLADAIRRGEVSADMKVGALLPLGDAPVAGVTLAELASHRSGLSALRPRPLGADDALRRRVAPSSAWL